MAVTTFNRKYMRSKKLKYHALNYCYKLYIDLNDKVDFGINHTRILFNNE